MHQPGTWRRLKIAAELRLGHSLPGLPDPELVKLLGLLVAIKDGDAARALDDDAVQQRIGEEARTTPGTTIRDAIIALARNVDVRPFL